MFYERHFVLSNMLIGDTELISPSLMCFTYILLIGEWNTSQLGQKLAFRQLLKMTERKQVFPAVDVNLKRKNT